MAFEAYSVAIKLSLINHVSEGLLLISKNMKTAHMDAKKFDATLASIGKQLAVGGAMFAGGAAIASMFKAPYEEAKKAAQAMADFATLNLSAAQNQEVYATAAINTHKILGSTITDNIKVIHDLHTAFGDLRHALPESDKFTEFATAVKFKNGGKSVDGLVNFAAKSLEHRGDKVMQNPLAFNSELNQQAKVYFGSNGRISPADYFALSQTGKMSYTLADADFLYGPMAKMIQAKTGATAGTAQMTTVSSLIGGHMTKKAIGFMRGLGLWVDQLSPEMKKLRKSVNSFDNDPEVKKIIAANGGTLIQSGGMPMWAATAAMSNTDKFTREILVPRIRKKYGNLSDNQIALLFTQQFNRNTSDDLSFWVTQQAVVAKDTAMFKKSMGYHEAYQNYLKSPEGAEEAAGAAWKNLMVIVGSVYLPSVVTGLEKFAVWLDAVGQSAEKNKEKIKSLVYGVAGLSATLMTGGLINMIAGAARGFGLLYTVMGGFTGFLGSKTGFIGTAMKGITRWMLWPVTYLGSKIGGLVGRLGEFIVGKFSGVFSFIGARVIPLVTTTFMWVLRAIPIVGWIVGLVSLGVYLYRNWDDVCKRAKALWNEYGHYITDGWTWVKNETTKVWEPIKAYLSDIWTSITSGIKSAFSFVWDQFAWLFDKLGYSYKESLNKVNPGYNSVSDALDFNKNFSGGLPGFMTASSSAVPQPVSPVNAVNTSNNFNYVYNQQSKNMVAPVPDKQNQTIQVNSTINLDGKTVSEVVTKYQTRAASRPNAGTSTFDPYMAAFQPGFVSGQY